MSFRVAAKRDLARPWVRAASVGSGRETTRLGAPAESASTARPAQTPLPLRVPLLLLLVFTALLLLRPWDYATALQKVRPVTLMIVGLTGVTVACGGRLRLGGAPLAGPLLGLWAVMFLTLPFSYWPGDSALDTVKYGQQVLLFALFAAVLTSAESLYRMAGVLVGSGSVLALLAVRAYRAGEFNIDDRIYGVGEGLASDPNDLAHVLVTLLPMAWWLVMFARKPMTRFAFLLPATLLVSGVLVTQSRGGLLALAAAGGVLVLTSRAKRAGQVMALAAAAAVGYSLLPSDAVERYQTLSNVEEDESAMTRLAVWQAGGRMFADHFVTGVGRGQFPDVYGKHYINREVAGNNWRAAHNSVVQVGAELGVFGLACWVALVAGAGRLAWRGRQTLASVEEPDEETVRLLQWNSAMLASFTGYVVGAMFLSRAYDLTLLLVVCLATASYGVATAWAEASDGSADPADSEAGRNAAFGPGALGRA